MQLAERRRSSGAERSRGVLGARQHSPEAGGDGVAVRRARGTMEAADATRGGGSFGEAPEAAQGSKKSAKIGKTTTFKQGMQW